MTIEFCNRTCEIPRHTSLFAEQPIQSPLPVPRPFACTLWPCAYGTNSPCRCCPADGKFLRRLRGNGNSAPSYLPTLEPTPMLRDHPLPPTERRLTKACQTAIPLVRGS